MCCRSHIRICIFTEIKHKSTNFINQQILRFVECIDCIGCVCCIGCADCMFFVGSFVLSVLRVALIASIQRSILLQQTDHGFSAVKGFSKTFQQE